MEMKKNMGYKVILEYAEKGQISNVFNTLLRRRPIEMGDPILENKKFRQVLYKLLKDGAVRPMLPREEVEKDIKDILAYDWKLRHTVSDEEEFNKLLDAKIDEVMERGGKKFVGYQVSEDVYEKQEERSQRKVSKGPYQFAYRGVGSDYTIGHVLTVMFNQNSLPDLDEKYESKIAEFVEQLKRIVENRHEKAWKEEEEKIPTYKKLYGDDYGLHAQFYSIDKRKGERLEEIETATYRARMLTRILKTQLDESKIDAICASAFTMTSPSLVSQLGVISESNKDAILDNVQKFERYFMNRYGLKRPNKIWEMVGREFSIFVASLEHVKRDVSTKWSDHVFKY